LAKPAAGDSAESQQPVAPAAVLALVGITPAVLNADELPTALRKIASACYASGVIGAIARHISIVAAFAGSLATIIPGVLLWPRLSSSRFVGSLAPYYLLEMAAVGAIVFIAFLAGRAMAAPAVWVASGLTGAFTFVAGFTIGGLYLPATVLFVLSGVLADFSPAPLKHAPSVSPVDRLPTSRFTLRRAAEAFGEGGKHLLLAVGAAAAQSGVMTTVAAIGGLR